MTNEIIIAGFCGQGVLFVGKALAYTGLAGDKNVSWLPSYGPEMRGGTCNCSVIVSDNPIGSPVITAPDILVAMNKPSLEKFENEVLPGGTIIYDKSLIDREVTRDDVKVVAVDATNIASKEAKASMANMIMLGALLKATGIFTLDEIEAGVQKAVPPTKKEMAELNIKLIKEGYNSI